MKLSKFILVSLGACSILSFVPITTSDLLASVAQCKSRCGTNTRSLHLDWCIANCDPAVLQGKGVNQKLIEQVVPLYQSAVAEKAAAGGIPPAPPVPPVAVVPPGIVVGGGGGAPGVVPPAPGAPVPGGGAPGGGIAPPPPPGVPAPARADNDLMVPVEDLILQGVIPINGPAGGVLNPGDPGYRDAYLDALVGTPVNVLNGAGNGLLTQQEADNLKLALANRMAAVSGALRAASAKFYKSAIAQELRYNNLVAAYPPTTSPRQAFFYTFIGQVVQADGQVLPVATRNLLTQAEATAGGRVTEPDGAAGAMLPGPITLYEAIRVFAMDNPELNKPE